MMKMDGRDSAEYQIWEMKGHNRHFGICFKSQSDKIGNRAFFSKLKVCKNVKRQKWRCSGCRFERILERERESFSLGYLAIRPSAVFGARRRNVLRGTGYAWTPGSGVSSNSLR